MQYNANSKSLLHTNLVLVGRPQALHQEMWKNEHDNGIGGPPCAMRRYQPMTVLQRISGPLLKSREPKGKDFGALHRALIANSRPINGDLGRRIEHFQVFIVSSKNTPSSDRWNPSALHNYDIPHTRRPSPNQDRKSFANLSIEVPLDRLHDTPLHGSMPNLLAPYVEWNPHDKYNAANPCHGAECTGVSGLGDPGICVKGKEEAKGSCDVISMTFAKYEEGRAYL